MYDDLVIESSDEFSENENMTEDEIKKCQVKSPSPTNSRLSENVNDDSEIEISDKFYFNPNNNKIYNDVSEFSDNENEYMNDFYNL